MQTLNVQLKALKIFCDVVRLASFSRGAAENEISQSSASQAVNQLEKHLGVRLIDRSKRPLVATVEGRAFYEGCREVVERYLEVDGRVRSMGNPGSVSGLVHVASIYSVGLSHMKRYAERFHQENPEARVRVEYQHPTQVVESVLGGLVELGIVSFPKKWPELTVLPWREEEMVLVVPPGHRLAGLGPVDVRELDGEPFVAFDADLAIRRAIDRYLRRHGVHVDVTLGFDNIEHIKRAVEVTSGVAILPEPTLEREVITGTLVAMPLKGERLTRPLAILHREAGGLAPTASRFLKLLTEGEGSATAGSSRTSSMSESVETAR
jgi:DNA-binding transcriptional LysR family regulator